MTSRVRTITVDCTDHEKLAAFWSAAIGYDEDPDNPNTPGRSGVAAHPTGR